MSLWLPGIALSSSVEPSETEGRRGECAPIFLLEKSKPYQFVETLTSQQASNLNNQSKEFCPIQGSDWSDDSILKIHLTWLHAYDRVLFYKNHADFAVTLLFICRCCCSFNSKCMLFISGKKRHLRWM